MPAGAEVRVTASGTRAVGQQFDAMGRKVSRFGTTGQLVTRKLQRGFAGLTSKLRGLGGMLALGGAAAGIKRVVDYRDALGQLQADANKTTAQMETMDKQIRKTSVDWKTNKDAALAALQVYQDAGGFLDEGLAGFDRLAKLSKATTTPMEQLAGAHAKLMSSFGMTPDEGLKTLELYAKQALEGEVALRKLGGVLPQILATGSGFGMKGAGKAESLGVLTQIGAKAKGGAEEGRTAVVSILNELGTKTKKQLLGVQAWESKGVMRDPLAIMKDLFIASRGDVGKKGLGGIFQKESLSVVLSLARDFDRTTGTFKGDSSTGKILGAEKTASSIQKMFLQRTEGIGKEAEQIKAAAVQMDDALTRHGTKLIKFVGKDPTKAAGIAVGGYAALKVLPHIVGAMVGAFANRKGKGKAGPGGAGGFGTPSVQAVYVVNMPGANLGQAVGFLGTGGPTGKVGKVGKVGRALGKAANAAPAVGGALAVGVAGGTAMDAYDKKYSKYYLNKRTGKLEGGSDAMATKAFDAMTKLGLVGKGARMDSEGAAKNAAMERAVTYLNMQQRGVTLGKDKTAITDEVIKKRMNVALGGAGTPEMLTLLLRIAKAAEDKRQTVKVVGDFFGLNQPTVEEGRGPKQGEPS